VIIGHKSHHGDTEDTEQGNAKHLR